MDFVKVKNVESPERAGDREAGIDFFLPSDMEPIELFVGDSAVIKMGIHVRVPTGHALIFFNKSGVASKRGIKVGAQVIDETFQGEVRLNLFKDSNIGGGSVILEGDQKIIQGCIIPINYSKPVQLHSLEALYPEKSQRGGQSFGSDYKEKASEALDGAKEKASEFAGDAKEFAGEMTDFAKEGLTSGKEKISGVLGKLNMFGKKK